MTVRDLIDTLETMNENAEVYIGMYQRFGSDFINEIADIEENKKMRSFWGSDEENVVLLIQGEQLGVIGDDDEENEED